MVGIGRFGPYLKFKSAFFSLGKKDDPYTVSLERSIEVIEEKRVKDKEFAENKSKYPMKIGDFEGKEVMIAIGKYGVYLKHGADNIPLGRNIKPDAITLEHAIETIQSQKDKNTKKVIREFPGDEGIKVLNGRYGPYISDGKGNHKIPKGKNPATLTLEECREIIGQGSAKTAKKPAGRSKKST